MVPMWPQLEILALGGNRQSRWKSLVTTTQIDRLDRPDRA